MEINSLGKTNFDTLFKAFNQAFADYEVQQSKAQLQTMLKRRGFDFAFSFGAFSQGEIVSFTCNGIGDFYGVKTAYDTGTGTLKEHRGKGLATRIFEYAIPHLKAAGIRQYLLEVLQHNTGAVSVYRKLGFEVTREFNYFVQENSAVRNELKMIDFPYVLRPVTIHEYDSISNFWDFKPSWQNNLEAIGRIPGDFISLGVFTGENLVGYCVFDPGSGDVTQLAVDKTYRRKGIASLLLREMLELNRYESIKVVNTEISCTSITGFLKAKNIDVKGKQFEMIREI
ncbi:GNAT family N-acetyltransferase [Bacteroides oleiciplenus]|uniref:N-acetyltransferase domain-containing protein n=1 Tax=Bacteroides oleiciplenus YIT 12058 TaxID=742727 RepID=K9DVJ6_9BACE|nr:GNAT family N-acetyltransferase [Bacteroides oleiciplenus]EKU88468.1 hypothetical protein HMPREF9447_04308 [Bacteroides oleiciplenus YIT 12058]